VVKIKKCVVALIVLVLVVLIGAFALFYKNDSRLQSKPSLQNVNNNIKNMYDIKHDIEKKTKASVEIRKTLTIKDNEIILFTVGPQLGTYIYKKDGSGRYEFLHGGGPGTNIFRDCVVETDNGNFGVLAGKNYDMRIKGMEVELYRIRYKVDVPKEEFFIVYYPIKVGDKGDRYTDLKLFDDRGQDITLEIFRKYFP